MILELIAASRLKRELNTVIRRLSRGEVDVFIVTLKQRRVAYVVAPDRFQDWIHRIDHAESEEAIRLERLAQRQPRQPQRPMLSEAAPKDGD